MPAAYTTVDLEQRSDLQATADNVIGAAWPPFMLEDPIASRYWYRIYESFPRFQFAFVAATGELLAVGNSVPLAFDGPIASLPPEGWGWALEQAFDDHANGRTPTIQCALSVSVAPAAQGQGLSTQAVKAMRAIGQAHGLSALVAPVRPMHKSRYPLTPMERYITWRDEDGLPFDGWLRVHARLGATIVGVCDRSMRIEDSVTRWERWTKMRFPETGAYVVPHALLPVQIDREADQGTYVEPNVWMHHDLTSGVG